MSRVFQAALGMGETAGRFEVEDFAKHIQSPGCSVFALRAMQMSKLQSAFGAKHERLSGGIQNF
jgi:hypothetical protein